MFVLFKDDELLKKGYNKIWDKFSNRIKKEFDSEPFYNQKYLKTKIKYYVGKINKNVHDNGIPKEGSHRIYLSVILLDSVFKMSKNYFPQVFFRRI